MTHLSSRLIAIGLTLSLFGAGCDAIRQQNAGRPSNPLRPAQPSGTMGFGKLPPFMMGGAAVATREATNVAAGGGGTPAMAVAPMPLGVDASTISARPLPIPYPPKQVPVEYTISGALPSWETSGDVLLMNAALPNAGDAGKFARSAGLPSQVLTSADTITSINLSWKDKENFFWSFDAGSRNVSFWKQTADVTQQETNIKQIPNDEAIRIADTFLDAHGFGPVRQTGGTVEENRNAVMPLADGAEGSAERMMYPCPAMDANVKTEAAVAVPTPAGAPVADTMIARPCGWWPQTITVLYGGTRDGKPVTDMYGYPQRTASVTINIQTKEVSGGNLQLDQSADRSSYPLIDAETAKKRLQSGGSNPVWPWGSENKAIKVHITDVKLVWMRYDNWQTGTGQTYFLPGLLASGTVDRGMKDQPVEEYRTVVPLVDDSAFDQGTILPMPVPMGATTPSEPPMKEGAVR